MIESKNQQGKCRKNGEKKKSADVQDLPGVDADTNDGDDERSSTDVDISDARSKIGGVLKHRSCVMYLGSKAARSIPPTTPQATTYTVVPRTSVLVEWKDE